MVFGRSGIYRLMVGRRGVMDNLDDHTPEEIAQGTTEFIEYLEECDGKECVYTWRGLMEGTQVLYNFNDKRQLT